MEEPATRINCSSMLEPYEVSLTKFPTSSQRKPKQSKTKGQGEEFAAQLFIFNLDRPPNLKNLENKHMFQTWGGIEKPSKLSQNKQLCRKLLTLTFRFALFRFSQR